MEAIKLSQASVNKSVEFIKKGGVVIFPTDTVYGFLALAEDKKAVKKIFKLKKRLKSKPLAVFVKDIKMAEELVKISREQEKKFKKGAYTFVLKAKTGNGTIALRIPKYKPLNNLLNKINKPLVQTSVNISGRPPLTKISDIIEQFGKEDILIVDGGNLKKSKPSKIIDLIKNKVEVLRK